MLVAQIAGPLSNNLVPPDESAWSRQCAFKLSAIGKILRIQLGYVVIITLTWGGANTLQKSGTPPPDPDTRHHRPSLRLQQPP